MFLQSRNWRRPVVFNMKTPIHFFHANGFQQELADCLKTNQSSISRRINQAVQMGLLTHERIKDSYKLAKEKEVEFDEDDF